MCKWLAAGQWFSPGTPVSSTNKTDRHDITVILLKVALNTTKQAKKERKNKREIKELKTITYIQYLLKNTFLNDFIPTYVNLVSD